ncbi:MAG: DegT/DnrJ/EryC1/StrS aminotransferase family protein [Gammaproteobacteria bacterium]|nr:DegT/DnrJ/EryC1/StrS aminotransferase family protein [Gammaproteobacteria bacterium]
MTGDRLPFTRPSIDEETIGEVVAVLRSGWLASGPQVTRFEAALSEHVGGRPVRVMTSATAALEIALALAGVGPGDEVITTPMSWCSTANVVLRLGARPVFADIDLDSRNLDLDAVEALIGPRTRALMPVHFAGMPLDLDRLQDLAARHKLRVVEDAAHAIGAGWRGRPIGSTGDLACFSFHPNKNITSGEGGAIVCNDAEEARRIELHRFNGVERTGPDSMEVHFAGMKANLSDIAAAIGVGQLRRLEEFNARRRELVARYFARWPSGSPLRLPARGDDGHCWHMFCPLLPVDQLRITRAEFIRRMAARGIAVGVHYPAIHLFAAYRKLGWREGDFPVAERVGRETVTLPLFPSMADSDVDRVVETVHAVVAEAAA